jgi:hypothetical protein
MEAATWPPSLTPTLSRVNEPTLWTTLDPTAFPTTTPTPTTWDNVDGDRVSSLVARAVIFAFVPWNLAVFYAISRRHRWPHTEGLVGCLAFIGIMVPVSLARFADVSTLQVLTLVLTGPCLLGSCLFGCPAPPPPPGVADVPTTPSRRETVDWESKLIFKQVLPPVVDDPIPVSGGDGEDHHNTNIEDGNTNIEDDNTNIDDGTIEDGNNIEDANHENDNHEHDSHHHQAARSYAARRPKVDIVLPTEEVCEICLEDFRADDAIAWSAHEACHHVYHKDCLLEWLAQGRSGACPICRVEF